MDEDSGGITPFCIPEFPASERFESTKAKRMHYEHEPKRMIELQHSKMRAGEESFSPTSRDTEVNLYARPYTLRALYFRFLQPEKCS